MPDPRERSPGRSPEGPARLEPEIARRILRRAAEEQDRLDSAVPESYTLEELEEVAREAGISPRALRAAAAEHGVGGHPSALDAVTGDHGGGGWLAALEGRMPASWSPAVRRAVLVGIAVAGVASLLLLPGAASAVYLVVVVSLVILLLAVIVALFLL
jgi:hypothetical protein